MTFFFFAILVTPKSIILFFVISDLPILLIQEITLTAKTVKEYEREIEKCVTEFCDTDSFLFDDINELRLCHLSEFLFLNLFISKKKVFSLFTENTAFLDLIFSTTKFLSLI